MTDTQTVTVSERLAALRLMHDKPDDALREMLLGMDGPTIERLDGVARDIVRTNREALAGQQRADEAKRKSAAESAERERVAGLKRFDSALEAQLEAARAVHAAVRALLDTSRALYKVAPHRDVELVLTTPPAVVSRAAEDVYRIARGEPPQLVESIEAEHARIRAAAAEGR
jgi:hypothetical protein